MQVRAPESSCCSLYLEVLSPFIPGISLDLFLHLNSCSCAKNHFRSSFFQRAFSESPKMDLVSIINVRHHLETSKTVVNIVYVSAPLTGLCVFEERGCFMFRFVSLPPTQCLYHNSHLINACLRIVYGRKMNKI